GKSVPVGTTIMVLAEPGEDVDAAKAGVGAAAASAPAEAPIRKAEEKAGAGFSEREDVGTADMNGRHPAAAPAPAVPGREAEAGERIFASPLARNIAADSGLDLSGIRGSGPGGRIVRKDVEEALERGGRGATPATRPAPSRPAPAPMVPPPGARLRSRTVPLSNMRATIARRLVQSKTTVPHYQVTVSARMDALLALRQQLNEQLASQGVKLSVNDFIVRACALAMHQHPFVNSRWND